ncbi:unnamed protein product [Effrenium voratum]|nr:unnamed protein product [Effrenium voratum]
MFRSWHLERLLQEGYCLVQQPALRGEAWSEIQRLRQDRSQELPEEISEGLLGPGSRYVVELPLQFAQGSTLAAADAKLTAAARQVAALGRWKLCTRSSGLLHQAGTVAEAPELTQEQCCRWFRRFARSRVTVLLFLGPQAAKLQLQSWEDDLSESDDDLEEKPFVSRTEVLAPGTLLLATGLRLRLLSGSSLTCFLQESQPRLTPPAQVLQDWALEQAAAETPLEGPLQRLQDHLFCQGPKLVLPSRALHAPGAWQAEAWLGAQVAGPDLVLEARSRWDHGDFFDPRPDAWREGRTYCRHAGFLDGLDLFDCRAFNVSQREAESMEPRQRQALEVAYESMHAAGFRRGRAVCGAGIYVGAENCSEWTSLQTATSFTATGMASSILAGRISFVLGLKGPAVALDTGDCSGLTAVHFGAKARGRLRTRVLLLHRYLGDAFSEAVGSETGGESPVALRAVLHLRRRRSGAGAGGGHGRGGAEEREATGDGADPEGFLEAVSLQHLGQTASLSAPSSSSEQELVAEALRSAQISADSVDLVEFSCRGTILDDAAEALALLRVLTPGVFSSLKPGQGGLEATGGLLALLRSSTAKPSASSTATLASPHRT